MDKIMPRPTKICEVCNSPYSKPLNYGMGKWAKRRFCSKKCQYTFNKGIKNEKSPNWRENVGLVAVHIWLRKNYGKANKCENVQCEKKSTYYDWAKITDKKYRKKRENFWQLCRKCHRKYDMTPKKKMKAIKNLHWYKGGNE